MNTLKTNAESLRKLSNCIRILSCDAIEKAKSGHPGLPLGLRQNVVQHLQQVHRDVSQRFRQLLRTHDTNPPMALISTVK